MGGGGSVCGGHAGRGDTDVQAELGQPPDEREGQREPSFIGDNPQTRVSARITPPNHGQKGITDRLSVPGPRWPRERSARTATWGFETASTDFSQFAAYGICRFGNGSVVKVDTDFRFEIGIADAVHYACRRAGFMV
jgi:hypothetical protein